MILQLPDKLPLQMPPGDADAIADLARDIGSAARCLAAVDVRMAGSAAEVPGWLGDDASAAAAQVSAVDSLVRAAHDGLVSAAERLAAHAERLLEIRSRVRALRHEQDEQFRDAWRRWGNLPDLQAEIMIGGSQAQAIVADVEAGEESRRRRQHALLEEAEDDTTATARVLADSCASVGGRGRAGEANVVVAYLAAQLPGWGDRELAARARALATQLTDGTPESKGRAASEAAAFAGAAAFATALLAALGVPGVTSLLRDLGGNLFGPDSPVARTLAASFGAAAPGGAADDPVARVLDAEYVHPEDEFGVAGPVATGLAMVLVAAGSMPAGGVGTRVVGNWGRQFLRWEHANRERIGTRSAEWAPEVGDPTGLAISMLADRADSVVSATLLDHPDIWAAALARVYDDGGAALGKVVAQAGLERGARGDRVVRLGLATAGAGLGGDDPAAWTVNRRTLAGVAPGFGDAVSAHVDVAVRALEVGADGKVHGDQAHVLAGLGYVTLDRGAAAAIEQALSGWAQVRPEALAGSGPGSPLAAADVLGGFVAVQEFAQRANHAMDALEDRAEAQAKKTGWDHSVRLVAEAVVGRAGPVAGLVVDSAAILLDTDGTWDDRPDRGPVFGPVDAVALARAALAPQAGGGVRAVVQEAKAAFRRTAAVLPVRHAPMSPKVDLLTPVEDLGIDIHGERMEHGHGRKVPRLRLHR